MSEDKQIVPQEVNLPAERMKSAKGVGEVEKEDQILPRLKIMQPTSPEVAEKLAAAGDLLNSVTKQTYGPKLTFVPITWWKSRIFWISRDDGGGIKCQAPDALEGSEFGECAKCDNCKWDGKEPPACTAIINIIVLINKEPIALSFMKTSYPAGKQLINLFAYKKVDIFNFEYELSTDVTTNTKGTFYIIKHKDANKAVSDEMYQFCSGLYDVFKSSTTKIDGEENEQKAPF